VVPSCLYRASPLRPHRLQSATQFLRLRFRLGSSPAAPGRDTRSQLCYNNNLALTQCQPRLKLEFAKHKPKISSMNRLGYLKPFLVGLAVFAILMAFSGYLHHEIDKTDAASFNVVCHLDHTAPDDPIVHPDMPGYSHMHLFFGNRSTNAYTTTRSLQTSSSSCSRGMGSLDLSAYWVPSLYHENADGLYTVVNNKNQTLAVYFQRAGGVNGPKVRPFPMGLRMVAGDAMAMSPQSTTMVWWTCGGAGAYHPGIPQCPDNQSLNATLVFPNCWDGHSLDSTDHKSHMAYSAPNGACPASHPVSLPKITYSVSYPGISGGPSYFLASGGIYSFHGDFFNAWNSQAQNALVASCLNTPHDCNDIYRSGNIIYRPDHDLQPINISNFK
jgi:uncharacterized protein DUF1996